MSKIITQPAIRKQLQILAIVLSTGSIAAAAPAAETAPAMQPSGSSAWNSSTGPIYQPVSQYPVEMGFWQDHSSTVHEGIQRGRAAVIQAQGIYEVNNAQANVVNQQARSLDLQNDLKLIESRRVRSELRHQFHVANRNERERSRAEGRLIIAQRKATVHRAAYQLSTDDFDRNTGVIYWPTALKTAKYRAHRERIEELFHSQFAYREPQTGKLKEIEQSITALAKALRSDLGRLPSDEYYDAHKFLRGLKQEAELMNKVG